MEPFYFGAPPLVRFGVYHPAQGRASDVAAILCYPLGHEYVRSHRAFRNLAIALNRNGVPVLRFDYVGTGDSSGESTDGGLGQWADDIDAAIAELQHRSAPRRVCLVGLRFGAALAVATAVRRTDVESVVAWDPVLRGTGYLDELRALQTAWLRDRLGAGAEGLASEHELMGMPVDANLLQSIGGMDATTLDVPPRVSIHIVTSTVRPDCDAWHRQLVERGGHATCAVIPSAGDWMNPEAVHQLLLPHEIIKAIAALASPPPRDPRALDRPQGSGVPLP